MFFFIRDIFSGHVPGLWGKRKGGNLDGMGGFERCVFGIGETFLSSRMGFLYYSVALRGSWVLPNYIQFRGMLSGAFAMRWGYMVWMDGMDGMEWDGME